MFDSGTTPRATVDDAPVVILEAHDEPANLLHVTVDHGINFRAFVSVNNGVSWICIPPFSKDVSIDVDFRNVPVLLKRHAGVASNVTGIFTDARYLRQRVRAD